MSVTNSNRLHIREEVAAYIRELIISGEVLPGSLLRLEVLAEHVQASVTPVREALLLLSQDGWIIQEPNRGFRVAKIRREDVQDTYLVQSLVAGELAARATRVRMSEAIEDLRRLDREIIDFPLSEVVLKRNERHIEDLNYQLHNIIYSMADAPRLIWFVESASRFVPRRFWATIPGWPEHNRTGHTPIIDAIEAGDAESARVLMSSHIMQAGVLLLKHLDSIDFWTVGEADPRESSTWDIP